MKRVARPKYDDAERVALGVLGERIAAISEKTKPTRQNRDALEALKDICSVLENSVRRELEQPRAEARGIPTPTRVT